MVLVVFLHEIILRVTKKKKINSASDKSQGNKTKNLSELTVATTDGKSGYGANESAVDVEAANEGDCQGGTLDDETEPPKTKSNEVESGQNVEVDDPSRKVATRKVNGVDPPPLPDPNPPPTVPQPPTSVAQQMPHHHHHPHHHAHKAPVVVGTKPALLANPAGPPLPPPPPPLMNNLGAPPSGQQGAVGAAGGPVELTLNNNLFAPPDSVGKQSAGDVANGTEVA